MAINYFEDRFSFTDYIDERHEIENSKKGKAGAQGITGSQQKEKDKLAQDGSDDEDNDSDEEEEEEEAAHDWDRAEAERMYKGTRGTL